MIDECTQLQTHLPVKCVADKCFVKSPERNSSFLYDKLIMLTFTRAVGIKPLNKTLVLKKIFRNFTIIIIIIMTVLLVLP